MRHIREGWTISMDWKFLIAYRIYKDRDGKKDVSRPAVRIAMAGIAIGLAVMIISVAVAIGFKHQVRDKVVGIGADIMVTSMEEDQLYQSNPIYVNDSLMHAIGVLPQVVHVQRYGTKPGMIMTSDNFQGMILKGIAQEYDLSFLQEHLLEGEIPCFSDTVSSNKVLVSKSVADKLSLKVGDKLYTYYLENTIRARRLAVVGIYQTNFTAFDDLFLLTDFYTVSRLNNWHEGNAGGLEIKISDYALLNDVNDTVRSLLDCREETSDMYYVRTVEEAYPQIFDWLGLLDMNVWVILILMIGVAGFTMISGLLIIILDRVNMIGILKALGANNVSIRKIFLLFSAFLIGKGMLWGNVVALVFCGLQYYFRVFKLDPATYYVDAVPIELNIWIWLLLNICSFIVSVLMLVGPSYLISRIHPARSVRFE